MGFDDVMTSEDSAEDTLDPRARRFLAALYDECGGLDGEVVVAQDDGWDDARRPWQLAIDQNPVAVVLAGSVADVACTVRAVGTAQLRIAPQSSGHHARLLDPLEDTVLLRTTRLTGIEINPETQVARIGAGVEWGALTDAAAEVGLAGPAGSSRDVGVIGYVLGGGLSWLARSHGLAANHVLAAEVVTADGVVRRIDSEHDADLFWAIRGGGGSFAVLTAVEMRLFPLTEVCAGTLYWPMEQAHAVLHAWQRWTADVPEAITSFGRLLRLPAVPAFPADIRGRELVAIGVVSQLDATITDRLLAPLRALDPELDTMARTAVQDLGHLHMDPTGPTADTGDGLQVATLPPEALDALLDVCGPESGCSLLSVELRQLGGAVLSGRMEAGALSGFDAAFALFAVGATPDAASTASANASLDSIHRAMRPWRARTDYPNFCERRRVPEAIHDPATLARLRRVKAAHDPGDVLRATHPVVTSHARHTTRGDATRNMERQKKIDVPNTPGDILAAVRGLVPELRTRSAEIERARELPADIVEMMRAAGVFRMGFAREFGGPGLTSSEQTEVVATLAYGDAAAGWCGMIGMDSGLYTLRPEIVRELFPSLDMIAAGMLLPAGRADRVRGGYRVSGRWAFASGITHADWVASGTFVHRDGEPELVDGRPRTRIVLTRPDQVELIDNWHATGLAGSGSVDYTISDVFVPEENTFSLAEPAGRTGALAASDAPMRKMPGVALGIARAALDHVRELARTRTSSRRDTGTSWSDSYRVQVVLGECEMEYLAMYHGVHGSLIERWDRLEAGAKLDDLTPDERIATMLTRLHAMRGARTIVRRLYDLVATRAIYATSPMDRWLRDLETMCQHVMAQEKIAQSAGAYLLGGTPEFPLALGVTG